ncbi:dynamin family protein [Ursidibacter sp. B-7004-1]
MTKTTHIAITYNPFLKDKVSFIDKSTSIQLEGKFKDYSKLTLQSWVNHIFDDLYNIFKSKKIILEFTALEIDCKDMEEAVKQADARNFSIDYRPNIIKKTSSEILSNLEKLLKEMENNPVFSKHIKDNNKIKALQENIFDIYVVANVSAGKSTFINSMLGSQLLPAATKPTTACITEIHHTPSLKQGLFEIERINREGEILESTSLDLSDGSKVNENRKLIKAWNDDKDKSDRPENERTHKIVIKGKFINLEQNDSIKLRLTDSPGTNNAQNAEHYSTTLSQIQDESRMPLIIYLMDKTTSDDDKKLLSSISDALIEQGKLGLDRFIFLVSKMDECFNDENNENITENIDDFKKHLGNILSERLKNKQKADGIENEERVMLPNVYPISPLIALLNRVHKMNPSLLGEDATDDLEKYTKKINRGEDRDLNQYMSLSAEHKEKLAKIEDVALRRSGVPALEFAISDYVKKYYAPYRIIQICDIIDEIIKQAEPDLDTMMEIKNSSQEELTELSKKLADVQEKLNQSTGWEEKIAELQREEIGLSEDVANFFIKSQKNFESELAEIEKKFTSLGEISKNGANKKLQALEKRINHFLEQFIADLGQKEEENKKYVLDSLFNAYKEIVKETVGELLNDISPEIKSNLQKKAINLDAKFVIEPKYVERKVVGTKKRPRPTDRGFFENLWNGFLNLFGDETVDVYGDVVDIGCVFKDKYLSLKSQFVENIRIASEELKEQAENLTEQYAAQVRENLESKAQEWVSELKNDIKSPELKNKISEAENNLKFAKDMKVRLNNSINFQS